jgi:hypothetical protein
MRGAAGVDGFREVSLRALDRLRRLPGAPETRTTVEALGSERMLAASARSLARDVSGAGRRPIGALDSVLDWIAREAARFRPAAPLPSLALSYSLLDGLLLALAAAPAFALAPA